MSAANSQSTVVRSKLIQAGVRNLREFGYPSVNKDNILTDDIFKAFFKSMLQDNLGKGFDADVNALLKEVS